MNDKVTYGLVGLLLGGALVWICFSINANTRSLGMMGIRNTQSNTQMMHSSNTIDAHFIEQMIPHHQDAITMAKLAQTKATRPEVKQLANSIISSQTKEIEQMRAWYKAWFGKDVPAHMQMDMMGDETDMEQLSQSEDFDKAFVEAMIPHHEMAVMMAGMLQSGTERPEMKQLATDITNAQTKEITQMNAWLTEWK
jgi:uncharacterized protein (DUF305 family)